MVVIIMINKNKNKNDLNKFIFIKKMNLFCDAMDGETKCCNRVTLPKSFCYLHKKNNIVLTNKKQILSNSSNKNKIILPNTDKISTKTDPINNIIQDCPICLCEIDPNDEDSGLICNHKFHIDCLNHIQKSECPVCRGPLEFINSSKVNINKIKYKEAQEMLNNKQKQITEDIELARRIRNEEEHDYNNNNHNHNRNRNQIFDMNFFIVELERAERLEEMRLINIAIVNSLLGRR